MSRRLVLAFSAVLVFVLVSSTLAACASDENHEADGLGGVVEVSPPVCPPPGPLGTKVGDLARDLVLTRCDGTPLALHEFCGEPATLVFNFYGW